MPVLLRWLANKAVLLCAGLFVTRMLCMLLLIRLGCMTAGETAAFWLLILCCMIAGDFAVFWLLRLCCMTAGDSDAFWLLMMCSLCVLCVSVTANITFQQLYF